MIPTVTAFETSPDRGRGLARDMGVRWALEEVGQAYQMRLLSFAEMKTPAHRARQPFGQIPSYEEGDLVLFEYGAIVLHIAQTHVGLLPSGQGARSAAISWIFAAVATIEPPVFAYTTARTFEKDAPGAEHRLPVLKNRLDLRLADLSDRLGHADWLDASFSAADLMMITVLRRLGATDVLPTYPRLAAYVERGQSRPAFQRAFAAQRATYENARPGGSTGSPAR